MRKNWRDIEWYDIKTKFKQLLRGLAYTAFVREVICVIISAYMKFVYISGRKIFINHEILFEAANCRKSFICVFWHNRLMMIPFVTHAPKKKFPEYNFMTLASRHGDGYFVGRVMEKIGLISIYGSSKDGRKSSRGIDLGSFKRIFDGLKKGYSLGITPDGPRGPNQKINGEIVNIARISGVGILPISYSCSRFKELKTWDKFKIPLPFSTLCFYFDDKPIYVDKKADEQQVNQIKKIVEERMNFVQEASMKIAQENV